MSYSPYICITDTVVVEQMPPPGKISLKSRSVPALLRLHTFLSPFFMVLRQNNLQNHQKGTLSVRV